jgi:hypothetical protein
MLVKRVMVVVVFVLLVVGSVAEAQPAKPRKLSPIIDGGVYDCEQLAEERAGALLGRTYTHSCPE